MRTTKTSKKTGIGFGKGGNCVLHATNEAVTISPAEPMINDEELAALSEGKTDEELAELFNTLPAGQDNELLIYID